MQKLLIANRGEIAIRIMHAAAELGIETVAVHSEDDHQSLHIRKADQAIALTGKVHHRAGCERPASGEPPRAGG